MKTTKRFCPVLDTLESRLVPAQILLASGADASYPTIWGKLPTGDAPTLSDFTTSNLALARDAHGSPIDFNKDGRADLINFGDPWEVIDYGSTSPGVVSTRSPFASVLLNRATGFEPIGPAVVYGNLPVKPMARAGVIDLNGDGFQDILTLGRDGSVVRYIYNPSNETLVREDLTPINLPGNPLTYGELLLKDFNGDGIPDTVLPLFTIPSGSSGVNELGAFGVWLGKADPDGAWRGGFQADPYCTLAAPNPKQVTDIRDGAGISPANINAAIADFNQDGFADLALPEVNGVTFLVNPGNGKFDQATPVFVATPTGLQALNLVVGDLNNDGFPDVASSPNIVNQWLYSKSGIWQAVPGSLTVFINSGNSGLQMTASTVSVPPLSYNGSIQLADLNLDGNLDLVVGSAAYEEHLFAVGEGDGAGGFGPFRLFQGFTDQADGYSNLKRSLAAVAVADMNNDGLPDIVSTGYVVGKGVGVTGISYNTTFPVPGAIPQALPNATVGLPYSQALGHTGGDPSSPYTFSLNPASVRLPGGMNLAPNGLVSGTTNTPGTYQLLIDVVQPNGLRGSSFVNLVVTNAQPGVLTISPATLPNATAGLAYSQQLTTTGGSGAVAYAISSGTLPVGLSLSPSGLISGTPTSTGVASFTVSATDAAGNIGYRPYTLTTGTNPTPPLAGPFIAAGSGQGGLVSIFNANGTPRQSFAPYGTGYKGAVTVAQGDVNDDGVADLVTGTGAGVAPHVLVLDGNTLAVIGSFYAYAEQFLGGVRVAAGDVDGDGRAEVVTGTGPGSAPNVCVFNGTTGATQQSFYAYAPEYRGGINVAAGDVTGDGKADIVTGSGVGVSPHVVVFDGVTQQALYSFYAYLPGFKGGVNVGVADVDNDGKADILTGAAPGADPHVKVFSGADGTQKQSFDAFATSFNGGVSVAGADLNGDGKADIIAGTQTQSAQVKAFNAIDLSVLDDFFAFQGEVGVWVAGSR